MKVSVDGAKPVKASSIVVFDTVSGSDVPLVVCTIHSGVVYYADAVRDQNEFLNTLAMLGVPFDPSKVEIAKRIKGRVV